jgi:excisionase family DNA binding protein
MTAKGIDAVNIDIAAARLGVSRRTVYNMISDGRLTARPSHAEGGGLLVLKASLDRCLAARQVKVTEAEEA